MIRLRVAAVGVTVSMCAGCEAPQRSSVSPPRAFDSEFGSDVVRILPVPGGELAIYDQGEGDTVLFYYPGLDHLYWQFQLEETAARHRAVNIHARFTEPDARPSPGAAAGPPPDLGAFLISFLEPLRQQPGFDRMHFVAHSIAGRMALEAAIARPELFATLVLEEPAGGISAPGVKPTPETCDIARLDPAERPLCVFINQRSGPDYYEGLSEPYRRYLFDNLQPLIGTGAEAFPSICDAIGRLTMPILFIRGADTPVADQSRLDHYEACLPPHETVIIPGAAHTPHMDAPDVFNEAILTFFERHPL